MAKKTRTKTTSASLSPQIIQFLGLKRQPFEMQILTEANFFHYPALDTIEANLGKLIHAGAPLMIVEGARGSGKTAFYRHLIQSNITNTKILGVQAEATDTLTQLQQKISLHLQDLGDANHLDENLKSLQMFDEVPVLVIDNAHVLSDTTLQELFRYQFQLKKEHEVALRMVLIANQGMSSTLQKITSLKPQQMKMQTIPPLAPKLVNSFITHKLRHAGYGGGPLLDEKSLKRLIKKARPTLQGYMQAAAPMIEQILQKKLKPGLTLPLKPVVAGLVIIVIIAALAYFFLMQEPERSPAATTVQPETILAPVAKPRPQQAITSSTPQEATITGTPVESADIAELNEEADTKLQGTAEDLSSRSQEMTGEAVSTTREAVAEETSSQPAPDTTASKPAEAIIQTPTETIPATSTGSATDITDPSIQQLANMGIKDAGWINQQHPNVWTLQLLGARDTQTLVKFVRDYRPGNPTAWYRTLLSGKPYYVLIHGQYPDRDAAQAAVNNMPIRLKKLKPWAKTMKVVQKAIQ